MEDSPSRRIARVAYWSEVSALSKKRWEKGPHLVMSPNAGQDVEILIRMGVPRRHIVAVGNSESAYEVLERHPGVASLCANLADVVLEYKRVFASLTIERNEPLDSAAMAQVYAAISHGLPDDALLGISFVVDAEKADEIRSWIPKELESIAQAIQNDCSSTNDARYVQLATQYLEGVLSSRLRSQRAYPSMEGMLRSCLQDRREMATGIYRIFRISSGGPFYEKVERRARAPEVMLDTYDTSPEDFRRHVTDVCNPKKGKGVAGDWADSLPYLYGVTPDILRAWKEQP